MSDIRDAVRAYLADGWAVVPLIPGAKKAAAAQWQKHVYGLDDFQPDHGVAGKCGEPSGWRVDVDCDALEAVEAARLLLPITGLIHGRPGKPDSHYWFTCIGVKTAQFTDVPNASGQKETLVELRSTGGYTVLPPSKHPSGETLAWTEQRIPLSVAHEDLTEAVRDVAIVSLLARRWPGPGARHHFVGHLVGFLCHAGVDPQHAVRLAITAARIAQDSDIQDRKSLAETTAAKYQAGEKVTGGPKLAESIGEPSVVKLRSWFKLKDHDALEEFSRTHFYVRMGKDAVIGREDDPSGIIFQHPKALDIEYANKLVVVGNDKRTGEPTLKPVFREWLQSPSRRSYRRVVFSPPPVVAAQEDFNLWRGFAITPRPGRCTRFLDFVLEVICSSNSEWYKYLLNLLAITVQQPGTPSGVAVVMRGESGIGKGIFVRTIGDLFGRSYYVQLDKVEQFTGHFNAALSGKIIVFADEAFWAGDKREEGALKRLITEPTLYIERKGIDGVLEDNHIHLFMATNKDWSWPAMMHERRGFLLEVSAHRRQQTEYFNAIADELNSGGREALLQALLDMPIDLDMLRHVPQTKELRVQQAKSLPNHLEWWHEVLYDGKVTNALGWPAGWCPADALYNSYEDRTNKHRQRLMSKVEFGRVMGGYFSDKDSKLKRTGKEVHRGYELRTLDNARDYFDVKLGTREEWPQIGTSAQSSF